MENTKVLRDIWGMHREKVLITAVERMRTCGLTFLRWRDPGEALEKKCLKEEGSLQV